MRHKMSIESPANPVVMRGLDPRIHPLPKEILFERWIAGSSPAMTISIVGRTR
jgi:hypothetical protein